MNKKMNKNKNKNRTKKWRALEVSRKQKNWLFQIEVLIQFSLRKRKLKNKQTKQWKILIK